MEEKKPTKVSLSTFFLLIAIIAMVVMGVFIYKFNDDKNKANNEVADLKNQVSNLQNKINTLENQNEASRNNAAVDNTSVNNAANSVTNNVGEIGKVIIEKITDAKANEIYNKAVISKPFLSLLIEKKDITNNNFSEEDILKLLIELDAVKENNNVFSDVSDSTGFYASAKLEDVQKLSQKYFGKTLDTNKLNIQNGDTVIFETPSGFGIIVDKLVAGYKMDNGDYFLTIEQTNNDTPGNLTYGLFVKYDESSNSIVYKGFSDDIVSYVSKFNSKRNI